MPVGAIVKVEVSAATESTASCIEMTDHATTNLIAPRSLALSPLLGWDTGHEFAQSSPLCKNLQIELDLSCQSMRHNCIGCATILASVSGGINYGQIDGRTLFQEMLKSMGLCHSFAIGKLTTIRV